GRTSPGTSNSGTIGDGFTRHWATDLHAKLTPNTKKQPSPPDNSGSHAPVRKTRGPSGDDFHGCCRHGWIPMSGIGEHMCRVAVRSRDRQTPESRWKITNLAKTLLSFAFGTYIVLVKDLLPWVELLLAGND